jgi:hypothetical protein
MTVRYLGATDAQVIWGDNRDPRGVLDPEVDYTVLETIETGIVPQYVLEGEEGVWNSACFVVVEP